MKVLNLRCAHEHLFEGWFSSDEDFAMQSDRSLIACPICGDTAIARLPSAPRLNVSRLRQGGEMVCSPAADGQGGEALPTSSREIEQARAQGEWLRAAREAISRTEDVGDRFPEEARRMHYGEIEGRGIRGRASPKEAEALREEGIEIMSIALPSALKDSLQ